jgi:energy-coupling factor transporter ATP-binding protein EcfA2
MVKNPWLLIVDEPCHGLDAPNRRRILKILEKIDPELLKLVQNTNAFALADVLIIPDPDLRIDGFAHRTQNP